MKNNHTCLNCGEQFSKEYNFCPECGQENSDKKLALGDFLKDFFSNTLSFDTILFKTINPFLFRPGKLTKAFNEGRRRRYINPIRLYLIFSLFYFFMISITVPKDFIDTTIEKIINSRESVDSLGLETLNEKELSALIDSTNIKGLNQEKVKEILDNSTQQTEKPQDTTKNQNQWTLLKFWASDTTLDDDEFKAKLSAFDVNFSLFDISIVRGFIANSSIFTYQAIRNLPLMMFFFLPVFALILMLLFFKKRYYIEHLIHGLHLHAFAYFIYGLAILLISLFSFAEGWLIFLSFMWVSSYTLFSIKRLYGNGWFKSFSKFLVLGILYFTLLLFGFLLELYISLISI